MFTEKTVFILGAGASAPYGFPLGEGLVKDIVDGLKSASGLFECIRDDHRYPCDEFAGRLGVANSVDAFLEKDENEELRELGKLCIAAVLLPKEEQSKCKLFEAQGRNWYKQLFHIMSDGCGFKDFVEKDSLSIVTFNYDRSLEYYLWTALRKLYGNRSEEEYKGILRAIKIVHVYGRLGCLPNETTEEKRPVPFGYEIRETIGNDLHRFRATKDLLSNAAANIQIISENVDRSDTLNEAVKLLKGSSKVFILGFGFHPTNIRRLQLESLTQHQVKCTTHNLPADRFKLLETCPGLTTPINSKFGYQFKSGWFDGKIDEFIHKVGLS